VKDKRTARLSYYEGIKQAASDHLKTTEEGLRKLEGVSPTKVETIVADLHKAHRKLLKRLDRQIKEATDRD
jgi:ferritin-like metal-binding protein YciE